MPQLGGGLQCHSHTRSAAAGHLPASCSSVQRQPWQLSINAVPSCSYRTSVCCGSAAGQSVRFRLDYVPPRGDESQGPGFHGRAASAGQQLDDEELDLLGVGHGHGVARRPGSISTRNRHAPKAAYLTPFRMPHQGPLSNEEYYVVDLERDYNTDFPSVERQPDGQLIFRPGFLQLLRDPDVPFSFVYSGVERFVYTLPERGLQALATSACIAAGAAAFAALASQQPELALALLASWLRNSLSVLRCAALVALVALDKMWVFWALLGGKIIDGVLLRHAPPLRELMWWLFKVFVAWCCLTTAITPVLPFGPFAPSAGGPFTYPFPIFRM